MMTTEKSPTLTTFDFGSRRGGSKSSSGVKSKPSRYQGGISMDDDGQYVGRRGGTTRPRVNKVKLLASLRERITGRSSSIPKSYLPES